MTQVMHSKLDTKYVTITFNGNSPVRIPTWSRLPGNTKASDANPHTTYEPERCRAIAETLKKGDCLFDVGVSDGWISAIYAQTVGAENICLFEPTRDVWANIKATWDANNFPAPRHAFYGFVSDRTQLIPPVYMETCGMKDGWPDSAFGNYLMEEMMFRSLKSTANNIPQTTIDDFVVRTGNVPRGISIDVEGAEFLVLKGAENTLREHHPFIYLSLHDINGALTYDFNTTKQEVFDWLHYRNYETIFLENYGDSHWLCK